MHENPGGHGPLAPCCQRPCPERGIHSTGPGIRGPIDGSIYTYYSIQNINSLAIYYPSILSPVIWITKSNTLSRSRIFFISENSFSATGSGDFPYPQAKFLSEALAENVPAVIKYFYRTIKIL